MNLFELFVKIGVDDQASEKLSNLSSKLGSGLKTAAKVGTAAVAAVGSGIAALGTYAAKVGSDFEAQMSKVSAISGATGDDLQSLEDKAKQLGIDTKFSATEAGQAFEYMAMAGWKTEQMLNGVAGIMDLAAASGEDLAMVSDIVTDAMTAFGLSAEQSTHFADVLAAASSNANTNVGLMGETFKYVAPVAGAMGYSIEDTAVAIGLMANAGIKGSQAGTSLRSVLTRLSTATAKNAKYFAELNEQIEAEVEGLSLIEKVSQSTGDGITELEATLGFLGISASDAEGNMRPLEDVLDDIKVAMSGLTQEEQSFAAKAIAGQEAMSGLLAIVNASETDINKLTKAIDGADGSAKRMADTMANNLQGQLTLMKSSAEGFGLAIYEEMQVPFTNLAKEGITAINSLTDGFREGGVEGMIAAAGEIVGKLLTGIAENAPRLIESGADLLISIVDGLVSEDNADNLAEAALNIIETLSSKLMELAGVLGEAAFELVGALGDELAERIPGLSLVFENLEAVVVGVTAALATLKITMAMSAIIDGLTKAWQAYKAANEGATVAQWLMNAAMNANPIVLVVTLIAGLVAALVVLWNTNDDFRNALIKAWEAIESAAETIFTAVANFFTETIPNAFNSVIDWFKGVGEKFVKIGENIVNGIKNGIESAWEGLKKWFTGLWDGLVGGVKDFLGIHSPSRVFADIGKNMALGVGEGWEDEFGDIQNDIDKSLAFDDPSMSINASIRKVGAGATGMDYGGKYGVVNVVQNIYSSAKTPSELMTEAYYQQQMGLVN